MRYHLQIISAAVFVSVLMINAQQPSPPPSQVVQAKETSNDTVKVKLPHLSSILEEKQKDGYFIQASRAFVAMNIKDDEPDGVEDTFPSEVKRLYCFSHIKGVIDTIELQHRWYWNDEMVSSISLPIKSSSWRTYSAKTIPKGMKGEWRVAIVNAKNDSVLKTLKFFIK